MKKLIDNMIPVLRKVLPVLEWCLAPCTFLAALLLGTLRRAGIERLPLTRKILLAVGVFPVVRHYYEPQFDYRHLARPLNHDRPLPGIDWNLQEQLDLLKRFTYADELLRFPMENTGPGKFHYRNGFFEAGDAEILYSMVRHFAPANIIEIGSGNSTLMVLNALRKNGAENPEYRCRHLCIEPYEAPWLEQAGVTVLRERVETVDRGVFAALGEGDILFVDSSHMIRPQGDVLAIYLEILPQLRPGVLVHIHDIVTPKDYFGTWLVDQVRFWNEQYLLEAYLSHNKDFRILAALNYLKCHHFEPLAKCCPVLACESGGEPGSFWLVRN